MYAFPQIQLPERFVLEARQANKSPDTYYALKLVENTVTPLGFGVPQNPMI